MAKGQKRGNREAKKPKKTAKKPEIAQSQFSSLTKAAAAKPAPK